MVSHKHVEEQLRRAGCNVRLWGRAEVRELSYILTETEQVSECLNGHYEGGFALLCATDQRLILIDRKPMFLTLEDVRYDMIAEIDYSHRLLDATIRVFTPTKALVFTSWNRVHLRKLVVTAQQRITMLRQYYAQNHTRATQMAMQQPDVSTQQPLTESVSQPLSAFTVPTMPAPTTTTQPLNIPQPVAPMGIPVNPFVRVPLTTRRRSW